MLYAALNLQLDIRIRLIHFCKTRPKTLKTTEIQIPDLPGQNEMAATLLARSLEKPADRLVLAFMVLYP